MAKRALSALPIKGESNWKNRMIDALTDLTTEAIAQEIVPIPLGDWRLEVYGTSAAGGGALGTDTTPILSQQGNAAPDIAWVATDVTQIIAQTQLPFDYQEDTNVEFHFLGAQTGSNDDVDVDIQCYVTRGAAAVSADRAPAVAAANRLTQGGVRGTPEDLTITILDSAANFTRLDILTFIITVDAHANDPVYMNGSWIEYTRGGNLPTTTAVYFAS